MNMYTHNTTPPQKKREGASLGTGLLSESKGWWGEQKGYKIRKQEQQKQARPSSGAPQDEQVTLHDSIALWFKYQDGMLASIAWTSEILAPSSGWILPLGAKTI